MAPPAYSILFLRIADRLDQAIIIIIYTWFCVRLLPDGFPPKHAYSTMLLVSEGTVLLFALIRRPTEKITLNLKEWIVALGGTTAVLLVENSSATFWPEIGAILILFGFSIHLGAKLSLRRSFGLVPADRGIKSTGLYAIVRHPMYLGYMISHVGFLLSVPSAWNFAVYLIAWPLFVLRIYFEENLLLQNVEYKAYADKVCYRVIPRVF